MSALTASVAVTEDGYLVLITTDESGNILLVGEDNHEGYSDGKTTIELFVFVEYV